MGKSQLRELAGNPEFISGIYNYCDRWCERCPFTARCLVYATEKADDESGNPESHDINNAKFWSRLESVFQEAHEMILDWAEEAGVDLEAVENEAAAIEGNNTRKTRRVTSYPCPQDTMPKRFSDGLQMNSRSKSRCTMTLPANRRTRKTTSTSATP